MPSYPGRPREFTYQRRREVLDHIGLGATVEEAARIVGVSLRTIQREAKYNEHFHHDLQLAVHAAPVDAYKLVTRAARTHWRAAAWLLERTDPDRFARRPPNSCSPQTLADVSSWLIETALESTPPEQRTAMYGRLRAVADKAFDVVMPDQHDARRCLVGALPHRPMPLSDHEIARQLLVVHDLPAPTLGLPDNAVDCVPAAPAAGELAAPAADNDATPAAAELAAPGQRCAEAPGSNPHALQPTTDAAKRVADPIAYYRRNPPPPPPAGRPRESVAGFRLLDSDLMDAEWRYPLPEEEEEDAAADSSGESPPPAANSGATATVATTTCAADAGRPNGAWPPEWGNYVAENERGDLHSPVGGVSDAEEAHRPPPGAIRR